MSDPLGILDLLTRSDEELARTPHIGSGEPLCGAVGPGTYCPECGVRHSTARVCPQHPAGCPEGISETGGAL
jgi:hypothetical protein